MAGKGKKPLYKRWWMWLLAVIVIVAIANGGGEGETAETSEAASSDNEVEEENTDSEATPDETVESADSKPEEEGAESAASEEESAETEAEDESNKIEAGTYKVGEDIPAGEYLVFASGMGYIENSSDSTGAIDSIIFNDNLLNGAHSYVTLNEGNYFKLQGAEMYPVEEAPSVVPEDGIYADGMYKVGQDIPAGEYKIILDSSIGMGYYEVSKDSSHQLTSIVTNENVQADTYLTISEGQFIKLQDVKIEK
ncbi:hypothetical protein CIL03_05245 [Virgibacillus indicus]|uniref:Cell surface protein n=1 Tax=Virgibacillus indicus TaxID=2024554 RepID=A0A265NFE4_9BACI|nr:hypothetical protein [Virgibacillus indicus]OZU90551.1 hypothetical protein CIL03_05245 [Virgibacillus indicus]